MGSPRPFDVLLRAIASAASELELADIRALASAHPPREREALDAAIAARRAELRGSGT